MRTLAFSLLLLFAAPFAVDTALADPVELVGSGSGSSTSTPEIEKAMNSTATDWDLVQDFGPIWGGMLLMLGLATRFIRANQDKHWLGEGRKLTAVVALAGLIGAVLEAHFGGGTWAGVFVTAIAAVKLLWSPHMPPKKPAHPAYSSIDLLIVLGLFIGVVSVAGCRGPGPLPVVQDAVIDCTAANRPQADGLIAELMPLLQLQQPDWHAVYERAKHAGATIGGCALAELVQDYLGGRKTPDNDDGWKARSTLEQFRTSEAGNATYKTHFGEL